MTIDFAIDTTQLSCSLHKLEALLLELPQWRKTVHLQQDYMSGASHSDSLFRRADCHSWGHLRWTGWWSSSVLESQATQRLD